MESTIQTPRRMFPPHAQRIMVFPSRIKILLVVLLFGPATAALANVNLSSRQTTTPTFVSPKYVIHHASKTPGRRRQRELQHSVASPLPLRGRSDSNADDNDEANFERRLELDAQAWARGDPGRLKWWERTKAWRRFQKMRSARAQAMSELERDKLRYVLEDVQRLTGLPLVGKNKEIKPLAWFMTIVIQLMPFAILFLIFDNHQAGDTEPVLDVTRPFWS